MQTSLQTNIGEIIKLGQLIEEIPDAILSGSADIEIEHIEYDSRLVKPNTLFVAINGEVRDGYDFVAQAKEKGAVAVLGLKSKCDEVENHVQVTDDRKALSDVAAKFYGFPGKKIKACGVTGTNGKTTTCYFIKSILDMRNKTTGMITSNIYDTGKEVFPADRTTPESLDLQRLLYLMKKNFCVNVVLEVSSHGLELKRLENIDFRVAVFTNISRDHLDYHKTMENYLAAKALLLKKLDGPLSYSVINLDVPEFRQFLGELGSSYISYSLSDKTADVYCAEYEIEPDKTVFELVTPMGKETVSIKLPGMFNLMNALAAASAGLASGIDLDNIVKGLEATSPVEGRFNAINFGQPFFLYVDFAHTPDAIERLCQTARSISEGRILLLFGCGGDRDKGKRALMGEAAKKNADFIVLTNDNPRSENPQDIINDVLPALEGSNHKVFMDREEAIAKILNEAKKGDIVLLAGKGAENYQEMDGVREPFNDSEVATRMLEKLGHTKISEEH